MLAVVQGQAFMNNPSGATAKVRRSFEQAYRKAFLGGANRRSQAGPAATDDGHGRQKRPKACIFQASQNLRKGVSATRWRSTGKPEAWISTSKVR